MVRSFFFENLEKPSSYKPNRFFLTIFLQFFWFYRIQHRQKPLNNLFWGHLAQNKIAFMVPQVAWAEIFKFLKNKDFDPIYKFFL